ncbi:MAG: hypothetical protein C4346_17280, partial [Chloroflexota bacterium]
MGLVQLACGLQRGCGCGRAACCTRRECERVRETSERFRRVIAAAWLSVIVTVTVTQGALAHAEPERANPPIGGTVAELPARLDIWFTEDVSEAALTVRAPDGAAISVGEAAIDLNDPERRHVTVALGPSRGPGEYVVEWRSVSASDGDAAEGIFRFTLAPGGTSVASPG